MNLNPMEYNNQRILTTEQLSEVYQTGADNIRVNFKNNKHRFVEGKHYYYLEGEALRSFKNCVNNVNAVDKHTRYLYLWTERGANRHCKILDTDKAWEQFENLEETYFRIKESKAIPSTHPLDKCKQYIAGERYIRTQARILIREGHSWHDVGKLAKEVAVDLELPFSPKLGTVTEGEQLFLENW